MNYELKGKWLVAVELDVTLDQQEVAWSFNFATNTAGSFIEIWNMAKHIAKEKIGNLGWKITKVSLTTFDD